jgi:hypothetical protein
MERDLLGTRRLAVVRDDYDRHQVGVGGGQGERGCLRVCVLQPFVARGRCRRTCGVSWARGAHAAFLSTGFANVLRTGSSPERCRQVLAWAWRVQIVALLPGANSPLLMFRICLQTPQLPATSKCKTGRQPRACTQDRMHLDCVFSALGGSCCLMLEVRPPAQSRRPGPQRSCPHAPPARCVPAGRRGAIQGCQRSGQGAAAAWLMSPLGRCLPGLPGTPLLHIAPR